eukprot:TRINITY_DN14465_c0_g1_i1.p1 TRINITY_DN14465_c0_g1~~TRINITY_DN14465_c0_g1_i1.p1  ORF type:complete len:306 (+),score=29.93 TRINITY_DN14465_c0_g1_i1:90-1007(+)
MGALCPCGSVEPVHLETRPPARAESAAAAGWLAAPDHGHGSSPAPRAGGVRSGPPPGSEPARVPLLRPAQEPALSSAEQPQPQGGAAQPAELAVEPLTEKCVNMGPVSPPAAAEGRTAECAAALAGAEAPRAAAKQLQLPGAAEAPCGASPTGGSPSPQAPYGLPIPSPRCAEPADDRSHTSDRLLQSQRDAERGSNRGSATGSASGAPPAGLDRRGPTRTRTHGSVLEQHRAPSQRAATLLTDGGPGPGEQGYVRAQAARLDACSMASSEMATSTDGGGMLRRILTGPPRRHSRLDDPESAGLT